jgi:hypothetical protein
MKRIEDRRAAGREAPMVITPGMVARLARHRDDCAHSRDPQTDVEAGPVTVTDVPADFHPHRERFGP